MNDKELLIAAAKAAGFKISNRLIDGGLMIMSKDRPSPHKWNPLKSNDDALNLAAMFNLRICTHEQGVYAETIKTYSIECSQHFYAAQGGRSQMDNIRRSIVKCVVEAGANQ